MSQWRLYLLCHTADLSKPRFSFHFCELFDPCVILNPCPDSSWRSHIKMRCGFNHWKWLHGTCILKWQQSSGSCHPLRTASTFLLSRNRNSQGALCVLLLVGGQGGRGCWEKSGSESRPGSWYLPAVWLQASCLNCLHFSFFLMKTSIKLVFRRNKWGSDKLLSVLRMVWGFSKQ